MNSRKNSKILFVLAGLLFIVSSVSGKSPFRSYGNDHLELTGGPGGSVFGQLWGLYHQGSDNVRYNPLALEPDNGHHLFLFHALLYHQLVTASSGAYTFTLFQDKPAAFMISRVGVDHIPDTRNALLDWGHDGMPGTGDDGEGNGLLDPGERLDYDQVSYHSSGITTLALGTSLRKIGGFETGVTIQTIMMNLIAEDGFGLSFDLHAYKKGDKLHSLYALRQLPTGVTAFSDGSVQLYAPYLESAWSLPLEFGPFGMKPGLTLRFTPGYNRDEGVNLGGLGNLTFRPGLLMDYRNLLSLGTAYDSRNVFSLFTAISLKPLTLEYAFRMHSHELLGNSHLVAISFDPKFLLEES
ncbi:hypothetical protein [Fidelibacter multiformis]|uniref:hypothetical protein n=1 Tax=Fidelibacter multiformis TaxID=3377529 RepID=UPI0037DD0648